MHGTGHVAKLLGARAEVRLTRAFGSGRTLRRRCGRERSVEVTVREQQGRRVKHESGEGEMEICDMHIATNLFHDLEPCVFLHTHEDVRMCADKMCTRYVQRTCACNR